MKILKNIACLSMVAVLGACGQADKKTGRTVRKSGQCGEKRASSRYRNDRAT